MEPLGYSYPFSLFCCSSSVLTSVASVSDSTLVDLSNSLRTTHGEVVSTVSSSRVYLEVDSGCVGKGGVTRCTVHAGEKGWVPGQCGSTRHSECGRECVSVRRGRGCDDMCECEWCPVRRSTTFPMIRRTSRVGTGGRGDLPTHAGVPPHSPHAHRPRPTRHRHQAGKDRQHPLELTA